MDTAEHEYFKIKEADSVEVLSLVDNSVDFLSTIDKKEANSFRQWTRKRYGREWARTHSQLPRAEHGFSMLIRVLSGRKSNSIQNLSPKLFKYQSSRNAKRRNRLVPPFT